MAPTPLGYKVVLWDFPAMTRNRIRSAHYTHGWDKGVCWFSIPFKSMVVHSRIGSFGFKLEILDITVEAKPVSPNRDLLAWIVRNGSVAPSIEADGTPLTETWHRSVYEIRLEDCFDRHGVFFLVLWKIINLSIISGFIYLYLWSRFQKANCNISTNGIRLFRLGPASYVSHRYWVSLLFLSGEGWLQCTY